MSRFAALAIGSTVLVVSAFSPTIAMAAPVDDNPGDGWNAPAESAIQANPYGCTGAAQVSDGGTNSMVFGTAITRCKDGLPHLWASAILERSRFGPDPVLDTDRSDAYSKFSVASTASWVCTSSSLRNFYVLGDHGAEGYDGVTYLTRTRADRKLNC